MAANRMDGKVVLITGGTGGIGFATALGLARLGARVIVSGRNRESGEAAVTSLRAQSGSGAIELVLGDLSTRAGVLALAGAVGARADGLDVLINNAGLMASHRELNEDGLEAGFAVNVVAPLLLSHSLLSCLRARTGSRIVTLTGGSHPARFETDNLQGERSFSALTQYSHHKLAMMGVMRALAQRLKGGPSVNVCYPGQASTRMTQGVRSADLPGAMRLFWPLFRFMVRDDGGRSAEKASRSSVFLASAPELASVTAQYFDTKSRKTNWPKALDDQAAVDQVVQVAERAAGLVGAEW